MQNSRLFAYGRVAALEKRLLSRDEIKNLTESDPMRVLHEKGYGGEFAGSDDEELLICGELKNCKKLVTELIGDSEFAQLLFLRSDILNLKLFIKQRLLGKDADIKSADENGFYDPGVLAAMVKHWEFSELPEFMQKELSALDEELAVRKNPQTVSIWLDRAYLRHAMESSDPVAKEYFGTEADFVNLITLVRMRGKGIDEKTLDGLLMPAYKIDKKLITDCISGDIHSKSLTAQMKDSLSGKVISALDSCDASALQKLRDDRLTEIIREHKSETEKDYPAVWYYIARQREAEIIRLCCNMRRSGANREQIQEKVRELYG